MDSTCDLEILIDLLVEINLSSHNCKESMVIFTIYRRFVIKSVCFIKNVKDGSFRKKPDCFAVLQWFGIK